MQALGEDNGGGYARPLFLRYRQRLIGVDIEYASGADLRRETLHHRQKYDPDHHPFHSHQTYFFLIKNNPSLTVSMTFSTRSSARTISLNACIAFAFFPSIATAPSTCPWNNTLSAMISPPVRNFGNTSL